jgi:GT2 family glycosyltransferase
MSVPGVSITIVTFNSSRSIQACLDAALGQVGVHLEIVVVDNASTDGTRALLEHYSDRVRIIHNSSNTGFAAGQNTAIQATTSGWVLTLNPDVVLDRGFVRALADAGSTDRRIGSVCGKLLRLRSDLSRFELPKLDSTGMFFTPPLRHFDRGWNDLDRGQYDRVEYVFGASAAAALYRRETIEDLSLDGDFFDPDFFAYREDADVAWRAQLQGWRSLYTPHAVGWHVRTVTPANRAQVAPVVNMHSVKNRFLMRIKNMTGSLYRRHWWPVTARDLVVVAGCLLFEHSSLPAFARIARGYRRALEWRRHIMTRRKATDAYIDAWFSADPVAFACPTDAPAYEERTPIAARAGSVGVASSG